jgi:hypothetical protein
VYVVIYIICHVRQQRDQRIIAAGVRVREGGGKAGREKKRRIIQKMAT